MIDIVLLAQPFEPRSQATSSVTQLCLFFLQQSFHPLSYDHAMLPRTNGCKFQLQFFNFLKYTILRIFQKSNSRLSL